MEKEGADDAGQWYRSAPSTVPLYLKVLYSYSLPVAQSDAIPDSPRDEACMIGVTESGRVNAQI